MKNIYLNMPKCKSESTFEDFVNFLSTKKSNKKNKPKEKKPKLIKRRINKRKII